MDEHNHEYHSNECDRMKHRAATLYPHKAVATKEDVHLELDLGQMESNKAGEDDSLESSSNEEDNADQQHSMIWKEIEQKKKKIEIERHKHEKKIIRMSESRRNPLSRYENAELTLRGDPDEGLDFTRGLNVQTQLRRLPSPDRASRLSSAASDSILDSPLIVDFHKHMKKLGIAVPNLKAPRSKLNTSG